MSKIRRRDLFAATSGALVGGIALGTGGCSPSQPGNKAADNNAQGNNAQGNNPPVRELEVRWIEKTIDGLRVKLRSYNGSVPGPLLRAKPGETLRIRVKNSLPPYDSTKWNGDHNVPHDLNTTNLHLHGLDIGPHLFAPLGTSDPLAKMIRIPPGESLEYPFQLPKDQPPGLFWYHPHHHGSTAVQAVSGMAGGMIVEGAIDEVPEIKAARDIPLVIQDIGLFPSDAEPGVWTYDPQQNAVWDTNTGTVKIMGNPTDLKGGFTTGDYALRYFLLNGEPFFREKHNPAKPTSPIGTKMPVTRIRIAPGEVVRFRMLNACSDLLMPILVDGHEVHLIALDGVNFDAVRTIPPPSGGATGQLLLAPANRAEFLIKGSSNPGVYPIVQLPQTQQFLAADRKVIAEIEVAGPPKDMPLPRSLPAPSRYNPLPQPGAVKVRRNIWLGGFFPGVLNQVVGIDFLVNNTQYQEQAVPEIINLGDVEEWYLQVYGTHHGGSEGHPFHIHVNHFEVVSIGGVAQPAGTIQDTVWIPVKTVVLIRMNFKQYAGKSVFHCHILPHEDTGMMQNFLILDQAQHGSGH